MISREVVIELLGEEVDESVIERIIDTGATIDEVTEAFDDVEHERRFAERRFPSTTKVAEVRVILEELEGPPDDDDRVIPLLGEPLPGE